MTNKGHRGRLVHVYYPKSKSMADSNPRQIVIQSVERQLVIFRQVNIIHDFPLGGPWSHMRRTLRLDLLPWRVKDGVEPTQGDGRKNKREDDAASSVVGVTATAVATRGAGAETGCLVSVVALPRVGRPPAELRGSKEVVDWDGVDAPYGGGYGVGGTRSRRGLKGTPAGASVPPPAGGSMLAALTM
jgi:hypothetical protein